VIKKFQERFDEIDLFEYISAILKQIDLNQLSPNRQ